jgi:tRNA(fMet)-specific endonuclease VapC
MARPTYLLDFEVIAELTRPAGNRRIFTLFQQRQAGCALAAPVISGLLQGVDGLAEGPRRSQLQLFLRELLASGLPVLPFDRDAALWLAREAQRQAQQGRAWSRSEGQVAAIAATRDLALVCRNPLIYAGTRGLVVEDWFRI